MEFQSCAQSGSSYSHETTPGKKDYDSVFPVDSVCGGGGGVRWKEREIMEHLSSPYKAFSLSD